MYCILKKNVCCMGFVALKILTIENENVWGAVKNEVCSHFFPKNWM